MFFLKSNVLRLIIGTFLVLSTANCSPTEETEKPEAEDNLDDKIEGEGIVGGKYVSINKFPYLAQIVEFDKQVCGAAIISEYWLLTAAHCIRGNDFNDWVKIVTRTSFRNEKGETYYIKQVIPHENFNRSTLDNDIALIEIYYGIFFNKKEKAIPIGNITPQEGMTVKVAGFGRRGVGRGSTWKLKGAVIPVVNHTQCNEEYKKAYPSIEEPVTKNMFCAGKTEDDTCEGDSGGPAMINGKLVGIISWGYDCGASKIPGVYTLVKNYREWIKKHTGLTL